MLSVCGREGGSVTGGCTVTPRFSQFLSSKLGQLMQITPHQMALLKLPYMCTTIYSAVIELEL